MGRLYYDGHPDPVVAEDAELAPVQAVVTAKLRRGEGFELSWTESRQRVAIWVSPAIDLRFEFDGAVPAPDATARARIAVDSTRGSVTLRATS